MLIQTAAGSTVIIHGTTGDRAMMKAKAVKEKEEAVMEKEAVAVTPSECFESAPAFRSSFYLFSYSILFTGTPRYLYTYYH